MSNLTPSLLRLKNSKTTTAIATQLQSNPLFLKLSSHEGQLISNRDIEDGKKLQQGIDLAISKNVLPSLPSPPPYTPIYVDGKSPADVSSEIRAKCVNISGSTIIILVGLSGTGKGTTVSQLKDDLLSADSQRSVVCWSNGNIFRSVTLLATTWCSQNNKPLSEALTPERLADVMTMLTFRQIDGQWDTVISGLGFDSVRVSTIENTLLKSPTISKNIPTVARETQGEVVKFAAKAMELMTSDEERRMVVLLEGRSPTVDYVGKKENRFELKLEDGSVVGKRRAAQRLMGGVLGRLDEGEVEEAVVEALLMEELEKMAADIGDE